MIDPNVPVSDGDAKRIAKALASYCDPRPGRAWLELALSAIPFIVLSMTAVVGIRFCSWIFLMSSLPAAAFLVRLFMIQHDCGHGSFFHGRHANDTLGRIIGVFTFTPYGYWRHMHARHHATSGNLDRRGNGDITLLTVREYRTLSSWRRLIYRLVRNPAVMLGLGPVYVFVFKQRLPFGMMGRLREGWGSVMVTNLAITAVLIAGSLLFGTLVFLVAQMTTVVIAGAAGIWLFYVQHQFEGTRWVRDAEWSFHREAIAGSSHYDLPAPLRWLTANIGIHHIHHLVSRIPCYRLGECLAGVPELRNINRLTLKDSWGCARLALWSEQTERLVCFRDAR